MKVDTTNIGNLTVEGYEEDYIFNVIKNTGTFYESSLLNKWLPYIKESKIILDIGANLGNHTLYFSQNILYDAIFSLEPFPANYERLSNNILNNNLRHVYPINKGAGKQKGYTVLKSFDESNFGATSFSPNIAVSGDIAIIDIDSLIEENQLASVDFIKIDTEGSEENVLSGMDVTLSKFHPDLWVEVSEDSFQNIIDTLSAHDYLLTDVVGFNMLFLHPTRHKNIKKLETLLILKAHFNNLSRADKYYNHYETAKKWLQAKEDKLSATESDRQALRNQLAISNNKYRAATEQHTILKERLQAKEDKLRASEDDKQLLADSLTKANEAYKAMTEYCHALKESLADEQAKLQCSNNQNLKLRNDLDIAEAKNKEMLSIINECVADYDLNIEHVEEIKEIMLSLSDKLDSLEIKETELTGILCDCYNDYEISIEKAQQFKQKVTSLEIQINSLSQKNRELNAKLSLIENNFIGKLGIKLYKYYRKYIKK